MGTPQRVKLETEPDGTKSADEDQKTDTPDAEPDAAPEVVVAPAVEAAPEVPTEVPVPRFGALDGVDEVTCLVPKDLRLQLDANSSYTEIKAGMQPLPREVAQHWWCVANGVTIAK